MARKRMLITVLAILSFAVRVCAQDAPPTVLKDSTKYSPYPEQDFPNRVLFGDTHLHTSYSPDAGMIGCRLGPEEAYRFARGETVTSSTGLSARLKRPLDFLVVSDHAECLGLGPAIQRADAEIMKIELGRKLVGLYEASKPEEAFNAFTKAHISGSNPLANEDLMQSAWISVAETADKYNEPGRFTAFIGFEWTSVPGGRNLHRVVVLRDSADAATQVLPISQYDSIDPERLWQWMSKYEKKTGGRVLAIPHNGNLSNGMMFDDVTLIEKNPLDRDYAERRSRWEPLYEVTQMKGDGEAHPLLAPDDEFADFETWDKGTLSGEAKTKEMLPQEYAREALKRGLAYEHKLGANPFKFGMIGSTDSHTALSTTGEDNFFGKVVALEPSTDPVRFEEPIAGRLGTDESIRIYSRQTSASGLCGVWARENTRESIWDAMARKEVFATSGTRLKVRVFAGYDFVEGDLDRSDFAKHGYEHGVPMGGDLAAAPLKKTPTFLVRAIRDADGANLDRVQIIKGWLDADGNTHERIYDIAVSDGRQIGDDGRCPKSVGNTVNVEEATYTNAIGDPYLQSFWRDPDFDAGQRAFYYVRAIEIPTPRWTTYDAKIFGVELPEDVPASIQERAYTSPIWYSP